MIARFFRGILLLLFLAVGCGSPPEPAPVPTPARYDTASTIWVNREGYYLYRVPLDGGTLVVLDNMMEGPRSSLAVFVPAGSAPEEPAPLPTPVEVP